MKKEKNFLHTFTYSVECDATTKNDLIEAHLVTWKGVQDTQLVTKKINFSCLILYL